MGNGASQADVPARLTREAACKLIRPCEWDPAFDEYFESSPGVVSATTTRVVSSAYMLWVNFLPNFRRISNFDGLGLWGLPKKGH